MLRPLVNALLPDDITVVTVRHGRNRGLRLPIYPRSEKYYWSGMYEEQLQKALWRLLEPGNVFWDIGAHVGFFSGLGSRKVGPSGCVIAVEPFPDNLTRLEMVIKLNALANVRVLSLAILEKPAEVRFLPHRSSSMGSIVESTPHHSIRVTAQSLDGLLENIPSPNVVKIDIEGAELSALRGGNALLERHRPALLVEVPCSELRITLGEFTDRYSVHTLTPRHSLAVPWP